MKEKFNKYICDFEGCRHRNEENVCCLFNQENCILFRTKRELEEVKANADYQLEGRDLKIKELEAQIEKMKCCQNCKYFECYDSNHYYCSLYCGLECEYNKSYKNWEIKEND